MNALVKFSTRDFRRGVDDALTLAPIRAVVRELAEKHSRGRNKPATNNRKVSRKNEHKPSN